VRVDRPPILSTPWQVVQNPLQEAAGAIHIPHWPQPGILARDTTRSGIRRMGYFGRVSSLPEFLTDPAFLAELERRGVSFHCDDRNWIDYSQTDVCVALRYESAIGLATKPASKLVNAWIAGVPALLGPEPAYRAARVSALDYLEVASGRDVLAALDRLIADPGLYEAMVANGRARAPAFDRDAVRAHWVRFLGGPYLEGYVRWSASGGASVPIAALLREWREKRRYRRAEARESTALAASGAGRTW